uniref:Uncharacterized protein n=1 Tax=Oryza brachyantha TaxID=4533 RepID=J3MHL6_ORYBR
MAVPSQRRLTGTVAGDGDPTTAAPAPPPTIAGDLCACIAASTNPLLVVSLLSAANGRMIPSSLGGGGFLVNLLPPGAHGTAEI